MRNKPLLAAGMAALLLGLPVTAARAASDLPLFAARPAAEFGGRPGDGLVLPTDVAVGADNVVSVVESGRHRVSRYDLAGNPLGHFSAEGDGEGELKGPVGIAVAPDGRIVVADKDNGRLQVFRPDGRFDRAIDLAEAAAAAGAGGKAAPVDVAVAADGKTFFVTVSDSHRVLAVDRRGQPVGGWGGEGEDPGQFSYPGTIALDAAGNVLVVDILNARVQVFDPAGAPRAQIGTLGAVPGSFVRPKGVAVDGVGRIYVSDSYFGRVQVFGGDGELLGILSVDGEPVQFQAPVGLAVAGNRLFVVDMLAGKIMAYDVEGAQ